MANGKSYTIMDDGSAEVKINVKVAEIGRASCRERV